MSHTAQITEADPALFVLMIDQSGSMNEPYAPESSRTKACVVAEVCNRTLTEVVARCRDGNSWRHYFDIAVIGYSGLGVYSLLPNEAWLLNPAQLASSVLMRRKVQSTCKTSEGVTLTLHNSYKVWIKSHAEGKTPMYGAFSRLLEIMLAWRTERRSLSVFPPVVINITDGEATDATGESLRVLLDRIKSHGTLDGEPLIFNVHISSNSERSVSFPEKIEDLPEEGKLLFHLSSVIPQSLSKSLSTSGSCSTMRAMAYNAGVEELIAVINIGSSTLTSQR